MSKHYTTQQLLKAAVNGTINLREKDILRFLKGYMPEKFQNWDYCKTLFDVVWQFRN